MNEITIYITVVLITTIICSIYGIVYVLKVISNQRKIEDEIKQITRDAIKRVMLKWG